MIRRRKAVFLTLWISYILMLVIPVALSVVLYSTMEQMMANNANRSNYAMLEQVRSTVDQQMEEIDLLISQIAFNPKLQLYWSLNEAENYITNAEAVTALKSLQNGNKLVNTFFIHDRYKDTILTPGMKTDTKTYLERLASYGGYSLEEQRDKLLAGYHFKSFMPAEPVYTEAVSTNQIAVKISLPLGERNNVRSMLVLMIDEQRIFDMLKNVEEANNAVIYIVDQEGQVLVSSAGDKELPDYVQAAGYQSGYRTLQQASGTMLLSQTKGMNDWQYISLIPTATVLKPINEITNWAIVLLVVALAIGTIVAYLMAYRNYSPIRDLVKAVMKDADDESENMHSNEYELIKTAIVQNNADRAHLKHMLANHAPVVRSHFLNRLLQDSSAANSIKQGALDFIGVYLQEDNYCVVLLTCDDSSEFRKEDSEQEWALVRFILLNLSNELIKENGYVTETEKNQLALLFHSSGSKEETESKRNELIHRLKTITKERFKMNVTIASSSVHEGADEIARCYREAMSALDYRIIHGAGSTIYFAQIKDIEPSCYEYPLETEVRLINSLKSGDYAQVKLLLKELYAQNMDTGLITSEMGKFLMMDLLSTVMKVINALKIEGQFLLSGSEPIKHVMERSSAQEMLTAIKHLCQLICNSVCEAKTDQGSRLNEQLKQYIHERYLDNSISLTSIADHFNMASAYISGFFKKHNHINLTEYITAIRIKEAKKLLGETGLTMMQIAQRIGYANDIGFIRVFKKLEGITPGKYRELQKQSVIQEEEELLDSAN